MKTSNRVTLDDTVGEILVKMCEGNIGAVKVCTECLKHAATIDPDDFLGGYGPLLHMDTDGIYGSRIWMLYKDVCGEDLVKLCAVLRAVQLGYLHPKTLDAAIDNTRYNGVERINVEALLAQVKARLPRFGLVTGLCEGPAEEPIPAAEVGLVPA